jgi:hypothetical protein
MRDVGQDRSSSGEGWLAAGRLAGDAVAEAHAGAGAGANAGLERGGVSRARRKTGWPCSRGARLANGWDAGDAGSKRHSQRAWRAGVSKDSTSSSADGTDS